jgi:hypothetical protein
VKFGNLFRFPVKKFNLLRQAVTDGINLILSSLSLLKLLWQGKLLLLYPVLSLCYTVVALVDYLFMICLELKKPFLSLENLLYLMTSASASASEIIFFFWFAASVATVKYKPDPHIRAAPAMAKQTHW